MEAQQQSKIVSAQSIRERAVKTRKAKEDASVSQLEEAVVAAIEAAHADKNDVTVPVADYAQDVVVRVMHNLKAEGYKVKLNSMKINFGSKTFAQSLEVSWNA